MLLGFPSICEADVSPNIFVRVFFVFTSWQGSSERFPRLHREGEVETFGHCTYSYLTAPLCSERLKLFEKCCTLTAQAPRLSCSLPSDIWSQRCSEIILCFGRNAFFRRGSCLQPFPSAEVTFMASNSFSRKAEEAALSSQRLVPSPEIRHRG